MIITRRNETFYKIEMTAVQAHDIQEFLIAARTNNSAFTACSEKYGPKRTDEIRESLDKFLIALEKR